MAWFPIVGFDNYSKKYLYFPVRINKIIKVI